MSNKKRLSITIYCKHSLPVLHRERDYNNSIYEISLTLLDILVESRLVLEHDVKKVEVNILD